jgi:hypothetical protein
MVFHQHVRGPDLAGDPVDEAFRRGGIGGVGHLGADTVGEVTQPTLVPVDRHHGEAAGGEGHRRRVTKRTAGTGHDRHLCAHGVTRPRSAAVTCSPSRSTLSRIMNSSF